MNNDTQLILNASLNRGVNPKWEEFKKGMSQILKDDVATYSLWLAELIANLIPKTGIEEIDKMIRERQMGI